MTGRYNRIQILRAIFATILGLVCFYLAYLFFRHVPAFVAKAFKVEYAKSTSDLVVAGGLLLVAGSGYLQWRSGGGLYGYHESALYHQMDEVSGGAVMMSHYAHRVTGLAYVLSQIFLAGPLQLLKAVTLLRSLLPGGGALDHRLQQALDRLRSVNKWQPISAYPDIRTEILYLAQMGKIDFSAFKGEPRVKAR